MSRFHFDESIMNGAALTLSSIKTNIGNSIIQMNNTLLELYGSDGFNISYAINGLMEEIDKTNNCIQEIETGKHCLDDAGRIVRLYTGNATIVDVVNNFTDSAIDKVASTITGKKSVVINNAVSSDVTEKSINLQDYGYPVGAVINDNGNVSYEKSGTNNGVIVEKDFETGGNKYILLNSNIVFEGGTEYCYKQQGYWFATNDECVATAMATTDMYNAIYSTPHYGTWRNYAVSTNYYYDRERLAETCFNNLKNDQAITIYLNYSHTGNDDIWNGHAFTVVGYEENTNSNSKFENLIVVDPWSGQRDRLSNFLLDGNMNPKYTGECFVYQ